jgi:hypothetical protein
MIPQALQHEPLYDINPRTGICFEVFYSDRTLETFGRDGAGWFWWPRPRGRRSLGAFWIPESAIPVQIPAPYYM